MNDLPHVDIAADGINRRPGQALAVVVGAGAMAMAIARRLGGSHRLLVADRDRGALNREVGVLQTEGHDAEGVVCDVADPAAVANMAAAARERGPVRSLAHVVGLSPGMADGPKILQVDLIGPALVCNSFADVIEPGGAAVFIASIASHMVEVEPALAELLGDPLAPEHVESVVAAVGGVLDSAAAYQFAKYGVVQMCRLRAAEWGRRGARIVSVSPGLIATPQGAFEFQRWPGKYHLLEQTPLQRQGTMIEVADVVEFLLSDRASFVTGTDLIVDGGIVAAVRTSSASAV